MQKIPRYIKCLGIASLLLITCWPISPLELFKETPQFMFYCDPIDQDATLQVADCIESFYDELSHKFNHTYSPSITISIYADLTSFHAAIGKPNAPDWIIAQSDKHSISGVSTTNPGPYHSHDSVLRAYKASLASLFIEDIYKHHQSIPHWLHQGIALYVAQFFEPDKVRIKLAQELDKVPTIEQLDAIPKYDAITFDQHNGFRVSYSIIQFIDTQWGWGAIVQLLNKYDNFENILGISKEGFKESWKTSITSPTTL
jgi:hypothetical protein